MVLKSLPPSNSSPNVLLLDEGIRIHIQKANRVTAPVVFDKEYFILIEAEENAPLNATVYVQVLTVDTMEYSNVFPRRGIRILIGLPETWVLKYDFLKDTPMRDTLVSRSVELSDAIHLFLNKAADFPKDKLAFYGSFYSLLIELKNNLYQSEQLPVNDREKVMEVAKLLSSNFSATQPTVSELAQQVGFSPSKLKILFRKNYGESPYQFHQRAKLAYAAELLRTQRYTISQVSYKIGYSHSIKFISIFKKHFGITPGEFKKTGISVPLPGEPLHKA